MNICHLPFIYNREKSLKKFAALELIDGGGAFKKSRWDGKRSFDLFRDPNRGCFLQTNDYLPFLT